MRVFWRNHRRAGGGTKKREEAALAPQRAKEHDSSAGETRGAERQSAETQGAETQGTETQGTETQGTETQGAETHSDTTGQSGAGAAAAEREPAATAAPEKGKARFKITLSVLIALTSLLGALAAWQAETASMNRDAADGAGFANSVADQQAQASIRATIESNLLEYERAKSYQAQAVALRHQAAHATPTDAGALRVQATLDADLAAKIISLLNVDAFGPGHVFDPNKEFEIDFALAKNSADFDSTSEFAAAERQATKADRLVGLTVLLIAAAFFFTLAQVASRRSNAKLYLYGGLVVFVVATILLLVVVIAT